MIKYNHTNWRCQELNSKNLSSTPRKYLIPPQGEFFEYICKDYPGCPSEGGGGGGGGSEGATGCGRGGGGGGGVGAPGGGLTGDGGGGGSTGALLVCALAITAKHTNKLVLK